MKLRLTVVVDFEPSNEIYRNTAPGGILQQELHHLDDMGIVYYLGGFEESDIRRTLQLIQE